METNFKLRRTTMLFPSNNNNNNKIDNNNNDDDDRPMITIIIGCAMTNEYMISLLDSLLLLLSKNLQIMPHQTHP